MTDRTALREFGKVAEKWLDFAERRRDLFSEIYRSGRWRQYYTDEEFLAQTRQVAALCARWAIIVQQHRELLLDLPRALAVNRDRT